MSITTVGSQLIHYEVLGRGQPLIFIHGWLGSWRYWWPSMQAMSSGCRSFAFDLWGFGDSSKAADRYSLEAYVTMIDQFIDQLGIFTPVTLIGHSLGAAAALRYTIEHPGNVDRLAAVALPLQGSKIHSRLADSDPDSFITKVIGKSNSFSEVDSELRKTDQQAMNSSALELSTYDFAADLAACTRPTLVISGDQDVVVQPPDEELQQDSSGEGRAYVTLDECNHFPMLQEKAKFNRLLLDFLHADETLADLAPKEHWHRRIR